MAQGAQFALFLVAARHLSIADFGIFTLILAISLGLAMLGEAGWREYAIFCDTDEELDETMTVALCSGGVVALLGAIATAIIFAAQDRMDITLTAVLLTIWAATRPPITVQMGDLTKQARLNEVAALMAGAELAGFAFGVAFLVADFGIVALALGKIFSGLVQIAMIYFMKAKIRIAWPSRVRFRHMVRFSRQILASRLLGYARSYFSTFIIGATQPVSQVGYYRAAVRFAGAAEEVVNVPSQHLGWSYLKEIYRNAPPPERVDVLRQGALRYAQVLLFVAGPIFVCLGALAPQVTTILLGEEWAAAAPILSVLAMAASARILGSIMEPFFALQNRTDLTQLFSLVTAGIYMVLVAIAAPMSLMAIAWAEFAGGICAATCAFVFLTRWGGLRWTDIARTVLPVLTGWAGCLLAVRLFAFDGMVSKVEILAHMALAIGIGCLAHLALSLVLSMLTSAPLRFRTES